MNMIAGILGPLVEGTSPYAARRGKLIVSHVLGGAAGGAATALVVWFAATAVRTLTGSYVPALVALAVGMRAITFDARLVTSPLGKGRQVPATWRARMPEPLAFGLFGAKLGSGILTFAPFALTFVVFATAALLTTLPVAVACGAAFGVTRALAVALGTAAAGPLARLYWTGQLTRALRAVSVVAAVGVVASIAARYL